MERAAPSVADLAARVLLGFAVMPIVGKIGIDRTLQRDVAFGASKAFVWDAARINLPDHRTALAMSRSAPASLPSSGACPRLYFPLSNPPASGLQTIRPTF